MENLFNSEITGTLFNFFFDVLRQNREFVGHLTKFGIRNDELDKCITDLLGGEFEKEQFLDNETFIFLEDLARKVIRRFIHENVMKFVL